MDRRELELQPRLQALADMVAPGARLADIGTDHGYVPVFLLQQGRISRAIASDIGREPLEHARRSAVLYAVDAIDFRLCAGLDAILPEEADTLLIAGMGGETIAAILSAAPWTRQGRHTLLLQPMSKQAFLRNWLQMNGYRFTRERLVRDKDVLYPIMEVTGGAHPPLTAAQQYAGVLLADDPLFDAYAGEQAAKLRRAAAGLRQARDGAVRAQALERTADAIEKMKGAQGI